MWSNNSFNVMSSGDTFRSGIYARSQLYRPEISTPRGPVQFNARDCEDYCAFRDLPQNTIASSSMFGAPTYNAFMETYFPRNLLGAGGKSMATFEIPANNFDASEKIINKVDGVARKMLNSMLTAIREKKKIDIDVVRGTFDCLTLDGLEKVADRGGSLKELVGNYIRQTYPRLPFIPIPIAEQPIKNYSICSKIMSDYAQHVLIKYSTQNEYRLIQSIPRKLKSIRFLKTTLFEANICLIKNQLADVEEINIDNCVVDGDLYTVLLKYCRNLKCLSIKGLPEELVSPKNFLKQYYPYLERFYWDQLGNVDEQTWRIFEARHMSQLKYLSLDGDHYRTNHLSIPIPSYFPSYELHMNVRSDFFDTIHPWSLNGLTSINIDNLNDRDTSYHEIETPLNELIDLKKLKINNLGYFECHDGQLKHFLESLDVTHSWEPCQIMSILATYESLKELYLRKSKDWSIFDNIEQLNQMRSNLLVSHRKLTIYIEAEAFHDLKWRDAVTNTRFVELKPFYQEYQDCFEAKK